MTKKSEKDLSPRRLAVQTLVRILDEGELSHIAETQALERSPGLSDRDRAFFHRLIKTVLEKLYYLDYVIDDRASAPVKKMKPFIRETLRAAVCQILFFDQIPASAAVNEAVAEVKRSKYRSLAGFVNAVLRAVVRDSGRIAPPERNDAAAWLSVTYSMPRWIAEHFLRLYGMEKTEEMFAYFDSEPGISVRVIRPDEESIGAIRESFVAEGIEVRDGLRPECLRVFGSDGIARTEAFREGRITVQDASSYLAVRAACEAFLEGRRSDGTREEAVDAAPDREHRAPVVYDVCAAPGGKSLAAAELLGPGTAVFAFDLSEGKCERIRENIVRCGFRNVTAAVRDARTKAGPAGAEADPEHGVLPAESCDLLICDLPCSGLGIMGRKKDIRYRLKETDLAALAALQREILSASAELLAPGGLMMYSTCTLDPAENEEQAAWIENELGLIRAGSRTFLPGVDGCDGFFYALFRKPAPAPGYASEGDV